MRQFAVPETLTYTTCYKVIVLECFLLTSKFIISMSQCKNERKYDTN